jgi:hypothetical protein
MTWRILPPKGAGVESPGMVNRAHPDEVEAVVVELLLRDGLASDLELGDGNVAGVVLDDVRGNGSRRGDASRVSETALIWAMAPAMLWP